MTVTRNFKYNSMYEMQNILSFYLKALIFSLILIFPFSLNADEEMQKVKMVITGYNQGIIKASKTSKTDHMYTFAKDDIVKKFYLWIKSWHDNNLFMDAKILNFKFKKVDIREDRAYVVTNEEWRYKYINIKTKNQVLEDTNIVYVVKYKLIKNKNSWIIEKIEVLSENR